MDIYRAIAKCFTDADTTSARTTQDACKPGAVRASGLAQSILRAYSAVYAAQHCNIMSSFIGGAHKHEDY